MTEYAPKYLINTPLHGATGSIVADSISDDNIRLTTMHLRYPRMIHSELMTHRVLSRNGRSSRAVPINTLLKEDGYMPHFLANKAGMVPTEEMQEDDRLEAEVIWQELIDFTKNSVAKLNDLKVHKQWGNRPLEWFGYIDVLISSTDWSNFMALRDEPTAQQEIQGVAKVMKQLMDLSEPEKLTHNEWHLPYVTNEDRERYDLDTLKKLSTARCARLSYRPFDGNDSLEREIERYERLMVSRPVHASPAEHVATPDIMLGDGWGTPTLHGNFYGWRQYRKMIPHNTIEEEGR